MKNIFLAIFCFFMYVSANAQNCTTIDMSGSNYIPNRSATVKDSKGDDSPQSSCWKVGGKVIGINFQGVEGIVKLPIEYIGSSAKLSIGERVGRSDQTAADFEPLNYGYNKSKMDPLDPGNTGARGFEIFISPTGPPTNSPDASVNSEYYYYSTSKANYPKSIQSVGSQGESFRSTEYVVNSQEEMMEVYESEMNGKIEFGDASKAGFELGGGRNSNERFGKTENSMIALYIEKTFNDNIRRTHFSSFTKNFLNAIEDVSNDNNFELFFKNWGTHYASSINLGSAKFKKETYSSTDIQSAITNGYEVSARAAGKGAKAELSYSSEKSLSKMSKRSVSSTDLQAVGGTKSPVEVTLYPIYHLLKAIKDPKFNTDLYAKMKTAFDSYYANVKAKNGDISQTFISKAELDKMSDNSKPFALEAGKYYRIITKGGSGAYQVDMHGGDEILKLWNKAESKHQAFKFERIPAPNGGYLNDVYKMVMHKDDPDFSNKCVTYYPDNTDGKNRFKPVDCSNTHNNQRFEIQVVGQYVKILASNENKYLDVFENKFNHDQFLHGSNGANNATNDAQLFKLIEWK